MNEEDKMPEEIAEERIQEAISTQATFLDLGNLKLPRVPESIGQLAQLQRLNLSFNQLNALPDSISQLTQLQYLDIIGNQLSGLPEFMGLLTQLRHLHIRGNQLSTLPDTIGQLAQLRDLYVSENQLRILPDSIGQLTQLETLSLRCNRLCTLPESISQLTQLRHLSLGGNQLTALPHKLMLLAEQGSLLALYLHDNDPLGIPTEILGPNSFQVNKYKYHYLAPDQLIRAQEPQRIVRYLRQLAAGPTKPLHEAKVLVVGPGGHGKSSLIEYLRAGTFEKGKNSTDGIKVSSWKVSLESEEGDLRLNVWDFGGQEIQYATHEFFLTERAVYLLVFQPRDDMATAQGLYHWLDLIHLLAPNAPVIVALSKQDEYEGHVNDAGDLKRLHPKLVDFIPISCAPGHRHSANAPRLRELVRETVRRELRHVRYRLPQAWMEVKEALERPGLNHLSYAGYQVLCRERGIGDDEDQKLLAGYLHDLGTMLNYADRMPLEDTHILNPTWVTEGVYAVVLSGPLKEAGGVFDERLLATLLNDPRHQGRYPAAAQRFILQMMLSFKLCYELTAAGPRRRYLVPNALPDDVPDEVQKVPDGALRFEIRFPRILPTSVMSRFIVAMHSQRAEDARWRLGLRSVTGGHEFLVTAHPKEKCIRIAVSGAGPTRVRALEVIRQHFAVICREREGLDAREFCFPPGHPEAEAMPFDELLEAEREGVAELWRGKGVGWVSVREWLDGVTDPAARQELQKAIAEATKHGGAGGRVNIYNIEKVERMEGTNMSDGPQYTQNITGSTFTNSPVAIQQMLQNSFNTVQNAPDGEVKTLLRTLHEQMPALLAELDDKQQAKVKKNLEKLTEEATSPEPDRGWLEVSAKGLTEAAKTCANLAAPVVATVQKVLELFPE